jgi:hypothetical protein
MHRDPHGSLRFVLASLLLFAACSPAEVEPGPDLAALMGEMQRLSMKLGFAIEGGNQPLAEFYLHEVEEVLALTERIDRHEEMPIGATARTIMRPLLDPLSSAVEASDFATARTAYAALIDGCNRCHNATEHGFVVITPATGTPPFNQRFSASDHGGERSTDQ